ncbi:glycosyltransferase family A protein [Halomonas sp.]|uniref:glycosyltransferase family 2 protein n=1 Tax=Halomonas sp. TaxID=1486246 RepID=UPI00261639B4|nr:glycosyltransferase family A protein [Halomonas sp.]
MRGEETRLRSETELLEHSPWFDAEWYRAEYPDVALAGLEPAAHYLRLGEALGRRPSPGFDSAWYLAEYPDVARAGVSPLLHFIAHGEQEGRLPRRVEALAHERELWRRHAGDPSASLAALEALLGVPGHEASYAAWALARWYAWRGEWPAVAEVLAARDHAAAVRLPRGPAPRLLEVEALTRLARFGEAAQCLQALEEAVPEYHDAALARANLLAVRAEAEGEPTRYDAERLALINGVWQRHGLAEMGLADPTQPLALDNLTPHASPARSALTPHQREARSPLVTVIVPAFKAADTLPTALASLAAQRGVNLEVIVVDDASADDTASVAEAFAAGDARFRVIRQPSNQGAYAARNRGLVDARGAFITVHDSDDWSHPDKLATQLAGLEENPQWMACNSHWVRCTSTLVFGHWRLEQGWIYRNTSSLMFRREVVETLGYWDRVRVDADTEYYHRIRAVFGGQALGEVLPGVPLAFGRTAVDSLTAVGATHLVTQFAGLRHDYQQAALAWHRANADHPQRLYLPAEPDERPFAAPEAMLP